MKQRARGSLAASLAATAVAAAMMMVGTVSRANDAPDDDSGENLDAVLAYVAEYPGDFGEVYPSEPGRSTIVIQVAPGADTERVAAARSLIPDPYEVALVSVSNSHKDLDDALLEIATLVGERHPETVGVTGFGTFAGSNRLRVIVLENRLEDVRAFIERRVDPSLLEWATGEYDSNVACTGRQTCWADPLRGGIEIEPDECTLGYIVHKPNDVTRILTAGHCLYDNPGTMRWHQNSSNELGPMTDHSYYHQTFCDCGLLSMNEPPASGWDGHKIYTNTDTTYDIDSEGDAGWNEQACQEGRTSGHVCGTVTSTNYYSVGSSIDTFYNRLITYTAMLVDSGAPVHQGHQAVGIQSRKQGGTDYGVASKTAYLMWLNENVEICVTGGDSTC